MGTIIQSCRICFPSKNGKEEDEQKEESDEEDNQLAPIQYSRYTSATPRISIDFPVRLKNIFKEHFTDPWKTYKELSTLGEGSFGIVKKVCLINHEETVRAMKIISKKNIYEDDNGKKLVDEISILKSLEHPNIMKIYECFEDKENVYIISEYCDEGDLLSKMEKLHSLNEIVVKFLMGQILNAVAYLHSNQVFHGDIKLENVMLYKASNGRGRSMSRINRDLKKDKKLQKDINSSFNAKTFKSKKSFNYIIDMYDYEIKLIDFGCCKYLAKKRDTKLSGIVGTSIYCSPEVIDDLYDEKSDEWSCGVLMYILLCGKPPFEGNGEEEIFYKIKKGKYDFDKPEFKNVSPNCKKLIKRLLETNPKKRIRAIEALHHEFFKENYNPSAMNQDVDKKDLERLLTIEKLPSKFHELIDAYLCYNFISKEEEKKLTKLFRYLDHKEQNRLIKSDFEIAFKDNNIEFTEEDINRIINAIDSDGNHSIEYQEFLRAMCDKESLHTDENLKSVFESIDEDKKGNINVEDIKNFIFKKKEIGDEQFLNYLNKIGMNLSSKLEYDDFVEIIRGKKLATFIKIKGENSLKESREEEEKNNEMNEEEKNSA